MTARDMVLEKYPDAVSSVTFTSYQDIVGGADDAVEIHEVYADSGSDVLLGWGFTELEAWEDALENDEE